MINAVLRETRFDAVPLRNVVGVGLLFGVAVYFAYLMIRPDMGRVEEAGLDAGQRSWRERLMAGWTGQEAVRLQVVLVQENTASARIIQVAEPVLKAGTEVRLVRKM